MTKSIGSVVDRLHKVREEIRTLTREVDEKKSQRAALEQELIGLCAEQDLDLVRGSLATASVSRLNVPVVEDWDRAYRWIARQKPVAFFMLERRISAASWREQVELRRGKAVPGIDAFEKVAINLRTLD